MSVERFISDKRFISDWIDDDCRAPMVLDLSYDPARLIVTCTSAEQADCIAAFLNAEFPTV